MQCGRLKQTLRCAESCGRLNLQNEQKNLTVGGRESGFPAIRNGVIAQRSAIANARRRGYFEGLQVRSPNLKYKAVALASPNAVQRFCRYLRYPERNTNKENGPGIADWSS
jgi:hypothetical protein